MADDQSHASANAQESTVTVVGAIMIVLAVLAVIFRFYTRYRLKSVLGWDDWMALVAVASGVAAGALVLAGKLPFYFHPWSHRCSRVCQVADRLVSR